MLRVAAGRFEQVAGVLREGPVHVFQHGVERGADHRERRPQLVGEVFEETAPGLIERFEALGLRFGPLFFLPERLGTLLDLFFQLLLPHVLQAEPVQPQSQHEQQSPSHCVEPGGLVERPRRQGQNLRRRGAPTRRARVHRNGVLSGPLDLGRWNLGLQPNGDRV